MAAQVERKEQRRSEEDHRAVADGMTAGFAVEDGVGLHFRGTKLERVVSSRPGGRAFLVQNKNGRVSEARLDAEYLGAREAPLAPAPAADLELPTPIDRVQVAA